MILVRATRTLDGMKTPVWILLLLTLPSLVHAQCPDTFIINESWTSYCDNGTARARFTLRVVANPAQLPMLPPDIVAEVGAIDIAVPSLIVTAPFDRIETNAPGDFSFIEESWALSEFPSKMVRRAVRIQWRCDPFPILIGLPDTDGPFAIPDLTCPPLPVATATWGAIKALYR